MSDESMNGMERSDREAWRNASRSDMAGKWSLWCADCGARNHKNASECERCGYGDAPGSFGVGNKRNVGRPEYTSDGARGVYNRSLSLGADRSTEESNDE